MSDLAGIVARDADVPWTAALRPLQVTDEFVWTALYDRRALLALLRETRDALAEVWASIPASFDVADPMVQRHSRALIALGPLLSALAALDEPTPMRPLYLSPSEAVVLRHALMSYRNHIAERNRDDAPYPMSDGFELAAADVLVERLDIMSEAILRDDQRTANPRP
jgi:hypothetical protein